MKTLTASDRSALIRLASSLPKGSEERRAILAGLIKEPREFNVPDKHVFGRASVDNEAKVFGDAWVGGDAWVYGNAKVSNKAQVYDKATIFGNAQIRGNAQVFGIARIGGTAILLGGQWDGSEGPVTEGTWLTPTQRIK